MRWFGSFPRRQGVLVSIVEGLNLSGQTGEFAIICTYANGATDGIEHYALHGGNKIS